MTAHLTVGNGLPADDLRPSYEEAIAEGSNPILSAPRAPSIAGSIQSLSLADGTLAPSNLRLKHIAQHQCGMRKEVTSLTISPQGHVAVTHEEPSCPPPSTTSIYDFRNRNGSGGPRLLANEIQDCPVIVHSADGRVNVALERSSAGIRRGKVREGEGKTWKATLNSITRPAALSPDGNALAATDAQNVVLIFETVPNATGMPGRLPIKKVAAIVNHAEPTHVQFTPDGTHVVTLTRDGTVRISHAGTGRTVRRMEVDGVVTATGMGPRALGVSPDGRVVVSVWSRAVYIWEHEAGRVSSWELNKVRAVEGWPLAISPDCRLLACRTEDGLDISDVYSGAVLAEVQTAAGIDGLVTAAAFSSDGKILAVGRYNGMVDMWNTAPF
ncbi:ribosome assembly protein 4 [Colletotrichum sojae]|uniref:Ribosome assembly protein 4 n=1 Tax=Colletotrichum sojae TaxID=2175907 RepID=A0A8H6J8X9_9PEZI|nr:ribosome assembly protein 4 [Colletotrichum sojae]